MASAAEGYDEDNSTASNLQTLVLMGLKCFVIHGTTLQFMRKLERQYEGTDPQTFYQCLKVTLCNGARFTTAWSESSTGSSSCFTVTAALALLHRHCRCHCHYCIVNVAVSHCHCHYCIVSVTVSHCHCHYCIVSVAVTSSHCHCHCVSHSHSLSLCLTVCIRAACITEVQVAQAGAS